MDKDKKMLGRPMTHRAGKGKEIWEYLMREFNLPPTVQRAVITLDLESHIKVECSYWPEDHTDRDG